MAKAELNSELIATVAGDITVYNYDGETREISVIGSGVSGGRGGDSSPFMR